MNQPKAEDSMKDPSQRVDGTNTLLAKILENGQQQLLVLGKILEVITDESNTLKLSLKVQSDSKALLQKISDALSGSGEGQHTFTVFVQQLASKITENLKK